MRQYRIAFRKANRTAGEVPNDRNAGYQCANDKGARTLQPEHGCSLLLLVLMPAPEDEHADDNQGNQP